MTIARNSGVIAIAAVASFGALVAMTAEASAQWGGRPGMRAGGPHMGAGPRVGGPRFVGGYRGGYYGGYRGGYRGGRGWGNGGAAAAGIIGGLALGALAAGAMDPGPVYAAPVYGPGPGYAAYGGYCHIQRERYWDGWGWRVQRVRVCD